MASVDIISLNFENKCDYPDNYEFQQHRRSSVVVEWYKKWITTASSTVGINVKKTTVYTHVNGDRPSHIENNKNKKVILLYHCTSS